MRCDDDREDRSRLSAVRMELSIEGVVMPETKRNGERVEQDKVSRGRDDGDGSEAGCFS